jgi:hypothetical protein
MCAYAYALVRAREPRVSIRIRVFARQLSMHEHVLITSVCINAKHMPYSRACGCVHVRAHLHSQKVGSHLPVGKAIVMFTASVPACMCLRVPEQRAGDNVRQACTYNSQKRVFFTLAGTQLRRAMLQKQAWRLGDAQFGHERASQQWC